MTPDRDEPITGPYYTLLCVLAGGISATAFGIGYAIQAWWLL